MYEKSDYAREKNSRAEEKTGRPDKKIVEGQKNFFLEKFFFLKRGIIIAPHRRRLYTRVHDSIA
jgi:hypothetical protein